MVGELDVAIADQKATVVFQNDQIVFCFSDFKTVRRFVNRPLPNLRPVGKLLAFTEIALKLQVGKRKPIALFPRPNWVVRWLSRAIREMNSA